MGARLLMVLLFISGLLAGGCKTMQTGVYREDALAASGEPAYITVQHCLIGFKGSTDKASRSQVQAEELARELYQRAQGGEDFDEIVSKYTDDSPPGVYKMANVGFDSDTTSRIPSRRVFPRGGMVPAFGDTGFPLQVGEYGLAPYDPETSPYGWHIVKRIK